MRAFFEARHPRDPGESESVYRMTIRAKALDTLRGLLPAATASNVGIYATGQAYEQLLLRMRAHALAEVRTYADLMLVELRKVMPAFLRRVDMPERGGRVVRLPGRDADRDARGGGARPGDAGGARGARAEHAGGRRRRGHADRLRSGRRDQGRGRRALRGHRSPRRRSAGDRACADAPSSAPTCCAPTSAAQQPAPQARPCAGADLVPLRRSRRLRRVPRSAAPSAAHARVAAALAPARLGDARGRRRGRRCRGVAFA